MRWIEVDTDFTDDPRIDAILQTYGRRQNWATGTLVRIWAYVGKLGGGPLEPGGPGVIGASVDSSGRPFTIANLAAKVKAKPSEIQQLLDRCAHEGHIDQILWREKKIAFFPAMKKRADAYTKKKDAKLKRIQQFRSRNGSGGGGHNEGEMSGHSPDDIPTESGQTPESVGKGLGTVRYGVHSSTNEVQERDRAREKSAEAIDRYEGPERRRPVPEPEPPRRRAKQGDGALGGDLPRDHLKCHRQPCGAICIPGRVHGDFLRQLGGENTENLAWLDAFYTRTLAGIPPGTKFGDRPLDFWRDHFAAVVPNIAPKTRRNGSGGPDPAAARTSAPDDKYDHLIRRATDDDQDQENNDGGKPN